MRRTDEGPLACAAERLWFAHWGAEEILAVDPACTAEVVGKGPPGLGWSIDWLRDGRLLVTGEGLTRREPDGSMVSHVDLSTSGVEGFNEIVVDGRGNIYLNGVSDFEPDEGFSATGMIALVTPDGTVRRVADGLAFPNGMVVTPDNTTLIIAESLARRLTAFDIDDDGGLSNRRVWAEDVGPDGICMDAEGAIWTGVGQWGENLVGRVREGGEVLERVQLDSLCFACMLQRTPFVAIRGGESDHACEDQDKVRRFQHGGARRHEAARRRAARRGEEGGQES
jgi:sugar lactone lactonase YvrE